MRGYILYWGLGKVLLKDQKEGFRGGGRVEGGEDGFRDRELFDLGFQEESEGVLVQGWRSWVE